MVRLVLRLRTGVTPLFGHAHVPVRIRLCVIMVCHVPCTVVVPIAGMWALFSAPMIMSVELRNHSIAPAMKAILQNKAVLAVSDDALGRQATECTSAECKHGGVLYVHVALSLVLRVPWLHPALYAPLESMV